jgi:GGDEF domain-containing protein
VGGHASVDDLTHLLSRHLRRMSPASLVVFYLLDAERDAVRAVHASGPGEELFGDFSIPLGEGLSGWIAANRRTIRNSNPALDFADRLGPLPTPMASTLSTALVCGSGVVGVLSLYSPEPEAFTPDHQQIVELVARPVAAAVERALLFEAERQATLTDQETGLPNDRYLTHLLTTRGFSDSLLMHSLGVLAVEWDETHAAPGGLRDLAGALRGATRVTDLMFRHGEQQVVVLVPDCDGDIARTIADRVTSTVAAALHVEPAGVRIGLACAPDDGDTLSELVNAAQARLRRHRGSPSLQPGARPHDPPGAAPAQAIPA